MRLKHVATLNDDVLPETTDPDREIRYVDISSVDSDGTIHEGEMTTFAAAPSRARRLVRDGDVIVSTVRTYLRAIAPITKTDPNMVVSTGFAVVRPGERLDPRYAAYALQDSAFVEDVVAHSEGVAYPGIAPAKLATLRVPVVSRGLQTRIADYLDTETARIDALIDRKQRFIDLLLEKRTALITHAVTKGLNPDVELKDSGAQWIGRVPSHWEVMAFRRCCRIAGGQVDPTQDPYADMVMIAPDHIESKTGRVLVLETAREQGAISGKYEAFPGDVIYSKIRPALAKACLVEDHWLCSADMYPVSTDDGVEAAFLLYWMLSGPFTALTSLESMRVAMPKVNRDTLGASPMPVPPMSEQTAVVEYLNEALASTDELVDKTQRSIDLLREYRTALISAAVTGQIDIPAIDETEDVE